MKYIVFSVFFISLYSLTFGCPQEETSPSNEKKNPPLLRRNAFVLLEDIPKPSGMDETSERKVSERGAQRTHRRHASFSMKRPRRETFEDVTTALAQALQRHLDLENTKSKEIGEDDPSEEALPESQVEKNTSLQDQQLSLSYFPSAKVRQSPTSPESSASPDRSRRLFPQAGSRWGAPVLPSALQDLEEEDSEEKEFEEQ